MTVTLRPVGLDPWAETDLDNDALSNYDEFMFGANPNRADSDGDGPADKWEMTHGFDPLVAQLAPPDPDSDGDRVSDRWELRLGTPTNHPAIGPQPYQDPDGDGFVNWYEINVLHFATHDFDSPGWAPPAGKTDILAVVASSVPCVLRLIRQSDNQTLEIPWHPAHSPREVRLRLTRGQHYFATLSRVPAGTTFTTDGFWWADLDFAVPPGIQTLNLPPVTNNGVVTKYLGTVCVRFPDRELPPWVIPGVAATPTATLAAWKIEIDGPTAFCRELPFAGIVLTEDALVEGVLEWRGLPPVAVRTGHPLMFIPSTVPPGRHTVTASAARNPLVADTAEIDILYLGVATNAIWVSTTDTNADTIALSANTHPAVAATIVWSDPPGIASRTFVPSSLTPGVYTVYLSRGVCNTAVMT